MASKLEPVTFFEAHKAFKQLNGAHTRKKSTRLEIVTEILMFYQSQVMILKKQIGTKRRTKYVLLMVKSLPTVENEKALVIQYSLIQ